MPNLAAPDPSHKEEGSGPSSFQNFVACYIPKTGNTNQIALLVITKYF